MDQRWRERKNNKVGIFEEFPNDFVVATKLKQGLGMMRIVEIVVSLENKGHILWNRHETKWDEEPIDSEREAFASWPISPGEQFSQYPAEGGIQIKEN